MMICLLYVYLTVKPSWFLTKEECEPNRRKIPGSVPYSVTFLPSSLCLFYLQFLLLFLTLHLALGQSLRRLLFEQLSTLGFESVQLGLTGQFCYAAVGAQLELTEPAQTETCKHITACGCQCWEEKGGNHLFWCKQIMWICLKIKQPQISEGNLRWGSGMPAGLMQMPRRLPSNSLNVDHVDNSIRGEWHSSKSFGLPCTTKTVYDSFLIVKEFWGTWPKASQ